jgi:glucosamine 6-phosphate synthetase-like amidotransferase/phosphosugar isomerase protein
MISEASPTGTIGSTSVSFLVKVEDSGSGVKEVKLIVDGVSQGTMSVSGNTYSKTISLSEGSHTWAVEAVDNVGNTITQNYSLTIVTGLPMEIIMAAAILIATATMSTIILFVTYENRRRMLRNLDEMIRKVKEFLEELEEKG